MIPVPPNYTECIAHLEATAAKPAKGQAKPTKRAAEVRVRTAVHVAEAGGARLPDLIGVGDRRSLQPRREGVRRGSQEGIRKNQEPAVPQGGRIRKIPGDLGSDRLGSAAAREAEHALFENPAEDRERAKAPPSKAEIEKYYKENPSHFGTPEKRNVAIILTKTEAQAKEAKKEIESGKSFASVAKAKSIDPTSKAKGGLLTGVVKGQEEAALNTAIFSAKPNMLSGPVKTPFGYYIYEVKSVTPGNQQTLGRPKRRSSSS